MNEDDIIKLELEIIELEELLEKNNKITWIYDRLYYRGFLKSILELNNNITLKELSFLTMEDLKELKIKLLAKKGEK